MKTITHDGKEYEVLPLDRISEITHAKLAGGKVVVATYVLRSICSLYVRSPIHGVTDTLYDGNELADFGIQPLKLLPKVPVEFVATAEPGTSFSYIQAPFHCAGKTFRCVEVTK